MTQFINAGATNHIILYKLSNKAGHIHNFTQHCGSPSDLILTRISSSLTTETVASRQPLLFISVIISIICLLLLPLIGCFKDLEVWSQRNLIGENIINVLFIPKVNKILYQYICSLNCRQPKWKTGYVNRLGVRTLKSI